MAVYFDKKKVGVSDVSDGSLKDVIEGNVEVLRIPTGVTKIKSYLFHDVSTLKKVHIPDTVTAIDDNAFSNCTNITELTLPKTITTIGDYACSNLGVTELVVPSGISCGGNAFRDNAKLKTVHLGEEIVLNTSVFRNCPELETVTTDYLGYTIPSYAFYGCKKLQNNPFPTTDSIGSYAFSNCESLSEIEISHLTKTLGAYAFRACSGLAKVTIGRSVSTIPTMAFYNCSNLREIVIRYNPIAPKVIPLANVNAFSGLPDDFVIKVSGLLLQTYKAATNWSTYADRIQAM